MCAVESRGGNFSESGNTWTAEKGKRGIGEGERTVRWRIRDSSADPPLATTSSTSST